MPWETVAESSIGGRNEQQDRHLVAHSPDGNSRLLAVADGAGGHKGGAAAAQTAIDCINQNLDFLWSIDDPETFINQLIIECNKRVLSVGDDDLACTTLVLVLIRSDEIFWGHVGDSRFYLIRNGSVVMQTTDHSVIELQRQQATHDKDVVVNASSHKLYMCLGALANITPVVSSSVAREGDTLVLCSDGFWGQIDMASLITELSEEPLTNQSLTTWIEMARVSKSERSDNITLVIARLSKQPHYLNRFFKAVTVFFNKLRTR